MQSLIGRILAVGMLGAVCVVAQPERGTSQSATSNASQTMVITRSNAIPSAPGTPDRFTGNVKMDTLAEPKDGRSTRVLSVTFQPGGYTAWHSHPFGQLLFVTAGNGYVQQWGGKVQQIHPGDVVWTPPNVKHWHGAGPKEAMTHIAMYEERNGYATKWMEKLTDAEYQAATR